MSAQTVNSDALISVLLPELRKLCSNAPQFGEISLSATIHDGDVGRISIGIQTTRKIATPSLRGGNR
ncbi:MAG: hypothetical protein BWX81_00209 [Spirochaetes bacterium ADurb.Bin110]|jgi:hypothetical protein|nr:MAG: hypothetical protein BWX81_00209 [Spirochaetes bacterium ADurb.Bin110]